MRSSKVATACTLAALAIGGCGDEEEAAGTGAELAHLAPPDAPVYAEAVVRPEGEQREELEAAFGALLGTDDPGGLIVDTLNEELTDEETGLNWEEHVEPWLGERGALFLQGFDSGAGGRADGAFVLETTDSNAALDAVRGLLDADGGYTEEAYEGTPVLLERDEDHSATAVVDERLVVGSEPSVHAAIDAAAGESLADSTELAAEFDELGSDVVAAFYADPASVLDALEASGELPPDQREAVEAQAGIGLEEPAGGSLGASETSFLLEFSSAPSETTTPAASDLLGELPADSWFAAAAGDVGSAIDAGIAGFDAQLEASPVVPPELRGGLEAAADRELGLDLRELTSWIGDIAFYARGTSIFDVGGAIIVETSDEQATLDALEQLRETLDAEPSIALEPLDIEGEGFEVTVVGAPVQIPVVVRDGRLVAGLGTDSVEEAFAAEEPLGEAEGFAAAADELGDDVEPTFFLDFAPLVELIESTGQAAGDPGYAEAKPYLDALDFFAFGQKIEDQRLHVRAALGVDEADE